MDPLNEIPGVNTDVEDPDYHTPDGERVPDPENFITGLAPFFDYIETAVLGIVNEGVKREQALIHIREAEGVVKDAAHTLGVNSFLAVYELTEMMETEQVIQRQLDLVDVEAVEAHDPTAVAVDAAGNLPKFAR